MEFLLGATKLMNTMELLDGLSIFICDSADTAHALGIDEALTNVHEATEEDGIWETDQVWC